MIIFLRTILHNNMADLNTGDIVRIDGKGRGTIKERIPRGFATFYCVKLDCDIEVEIASERLVKIPQTVVNVPTPVDPPQQTSTSQRFIPVNQSDIGTFIENQANKNTLIKTVADLKILKSFFDSPEIQETRNVQDTPLQIYPLCCQGFS